MNLTQAIGAILSIALKDLRLLVRDKAAAFFTFIFPMLLAVFFGFVFGGGGDGGNLTLGIVDEDRTQGSGQFVQDLEKVAGLGVRRFEAADQAQQAIRRGEVDAAVVLPRGFADSTSSVFSGQGMEIKGYIAPGAGAQAGLLTGKLTELGFRRLMDSFTSPRLLQTQLDRARQQLGQQEDITPQRRGVISSFLDSVQAFSEDMDERDRAEEASTDSGEKATSALGDWTPVRVTLEEVSRQGAGPRSGFEVSFPQGVVWGLMGCTLAFGISLAEERSRGTLLRLTTAPLSRGHILLGKAVGCFVSCTLVQAILIVMALLPPFRVQVTSPVAMIAAVLLCSVGFTGVMMLLAGFAKTETAAQGVGRAVMIVLALVGGGSVPLFILPKIVQTLSGVSPFRWATLLIEGGLWRQFELADMLLPGGIMIGLGVGGFALGAAMFRWQE
ncbi:MAG: ABC transporter permease [Phycisphaerales bacterium]|nr:ABC transporter permease [Phycisphaerales bacterium]